MTAPPVDLSLPPFYTQYLDAAGIPIVGSTKVSTSALEEARQIVIVMVGRRQDLIAALRRSRVRVAVMGRAEQTLDVPEHADLKTAFPGTDWNARARGLGATAARPVCSAAEENLLREQNDRYRGESILIHEFGHTVLDLGVAAVDRGFRTRVEAAWSLATREGRFRKTYAAGSMDEYWAEGVQDWFDANQEADPPDGIHNRINTRSELVRYDPALAALLRSVFGDRPWRWSRRPASSR